MSDSSSDGPFGGGMPDLGELMRAAQQIQSDVQKMQEDLGNKRCEASAGGGMVTAVVNGHFELVSLSIEPQVVDPSDLEMLQDLVVAAVNQAVTKMRELTQAEMAKLTGGLGLPGMPPLF